MRRGAFTAVATAVTFVLLSAGCSDGDAGTRPTPSTSGGQSVAETTTPSPTPTVERPEMPAAAKKAGIAGAEAFIRHYIDTLNYAYTTGDLEPTQAIREGDCVACIGIEGVISDGYRDGHRIEGGQLTVGEIVVTPGDPGVGVSAGVIVAQEEARVLDSAGSVVDKFPPTPRDRFKFVVENDGAWRVIAWGDDELPE